MEKLRWCARQKHGIELVEPSDNLREGYIRKAEESLESAMLVRSRDWKITALYYTIYFGIYSLLMKIGIRCEIHSCTIALAKTILSFSDEELILIDTAFEARKNAQYYVNMEVPDADYDMLLEQTPSFLVRCKNMVIDEKRVRLVRRMISGMQTDHR